MSVVIGEFELVEAPPQDARPSSPPGAAEPTQPPLSLTDLAALQRLMIERALRLYAD
jgi:hypothetical protein